MQEIYEKLNKLIDLICFISICLTGFYVAIWFYCAAGLPSAWVYNSPVNIFPGIFQSLFHPYVMSQFGQIDMSFLVVAAIFFIIYLTATYLVKWTDNQAYKCELGRIEQRKKIEKLVNAELEEENKQYVMEYKCAIVTIKLHFNYLVDPNIIDNRVEISDIEKRSYEKLISDTNFPYPVQSGKVDNQAYFILEKFWYIEHFVKTMLKAIKVIYDKNLENDVKTSFTFSADALRSPNNFQAELQGLVKISSFEYKNKVVVTLPFLRRYDLKENKVFDFHTMGISRYFEKNSDANSPDKFKTQDFELYYIRSKRKKF